MLQNAYFLAKIGAGIAENEQHFAENLPKIGNYPTGVAPASSGPAVRRTVGRRREAECCSFSAASAPIFASKYAFCSIFQNLPDYHAEIFEINFGKILQILQILQIFC